MLGDLDDILSRPANSSFAAADFEEAADRLLHHQCLFRDDHNCKSHYELIVRFKTYFRDLFEALGRDLVISERELMIELRPRQSVSRMTLTLDETVLLLGLRAAFEQGVAEYAQGDVGEIETTSMDLLERYEPMTGRQRPTWPRVREILKSFQRRRFIRLGTEFADESGVAITIRPAIRGVTSEGYLARIEQFIENQLAEDGDRSSPAAVDVSEDTEETEQPEAVA